jgi:prepilin-type N-terminal cleavage/methylation domain-containing protein
MTSPTPSKGFTVIEIMMAIALIAIMAVVATDVITDTISEGRFEETVAKMNAIQNAMVGDPSLMESGSRTSFGFLGDVGAIPTAAQGIAALVSQPTPALPAYAVNATARFGLGWNGPYLSSMSSGTDYTKDAWGNAFVYSPTASPPTLVSYGSNGVAGGTGLNQDITVNLPTEIRTATVNGFICSSGGPISSAASVTLYYPDGSGALTTNTQALAAGVKGQFSYASVPMGVRSVSVTVGATTVGPVLITVDKPNYMIPCNKIDVNP